MWKKIANNKYIIVILIVICSFFVYRAIVYIKGQEGKGKRETTRPVDKVKNKGKGAQKAEGETTLFSLDLLEWKNPAFNPDGRNLFDYTESPEEIERRKQIREQREKEEAERKRREEERRRKEIEEQQERARARREQEKQREEAVSMSRQPPKPKPPKVNYKYIGFIGPSKDRVAALVNTEGKLLLGRRNDTIEDVYKIVEVGFFEVKVGWVDFEGYESVFRE